MVSMFLSRTVLVYYDYVVGPLLNARFSDQRRKTDKYNLMLGGWSTKLKKVKRKLAKLSSTIASLKLNKEKLLKVVK